MTGRMSVEMEEVFLFDRSLIVCHNKGKTGLFGMEDEYSFWIRFPMNTLKVGVNFNFFIEFPWQVEDRDPEGPNFIVVDSSTSEEEDASSEMTFEARTEAVKKVWMRELRKKTDRRSRLLSVLTTGQCGQGPS